MWRTFGLVIVLVLLAACAGRDQTSTPTLIPLDPTTLVEQLAATGTPQPPTPIPLPSATPTPTPFPALTTDFTSTTEPAIGPGRAPDVIQSVAELTVVEVGPAVTPSPSGAATQATATTPLASEQSKGRLILTTRSGGDLYMINLDGSGRHKLAGGVIDPVVSPDGTQVAFTRWDGDEWGAVYAVRLADGLERVIAGGILQPKSPTWSPDGQTLVISFQHGGLRDPDQECRRFDLGERVRIPDDAQITGTTYNGDKAQLIICFIRAEDLQWYLRRIDAATGQFEDLPSDLYSYNPIWSPQNPNRIIYDGPKGLMQLDMTTLDKQPVTTDLRDTGPVFAPDGQRLALTYRQHDHWEVYTLDLASGARQRLTKPPILAEPQYNSAAPAWSPDGSQLAFLTDRMGRWEIWVMDSDGSEPRPLLAPALQAQLDLEYAGVNERMLNWIE